MPLTNNQTEKNQSKDYWPMFSFLIVVIIIAVGYFVLYPQMTKVKSINIQIEVKDRETEALENKISDLNSLKKVFEGDQELIKIYDLALPDNDEVAEIIESINSMAGISALEITSINQKKAGKETTNTLMEIGFAGTYQGLNLLIENLQKNIRACQIKAITISKEQNQEGETGDLIKGKIEAEFFKVGGDKTGKNTEEVKE